MSMLTYWHNPRCTKSREGLAVLREKGIEPEVREYLKDVPHAEELKAVASKLGVDSAREMMRTKEDAYKANNLADETDEGRLFEAMAAHPKLIERPVLIGDEKAAIGRPTENLFAALPSGR